MNKRLLSKHRIFVLSVLPLVLLAIILAEVSFRLYKMNAPEHTTRRIQVQDEARVPTPYVMFKGLPGGANRNEFGHRGKAPKFPKPDDEYRIFILGPSTVDGSHIVREFNKIIKEKNTLIDGKIPTMYNFGITSAISKQLFVYYATELANYSPDSVIMYSGAVDVANPISFDPRPGYPYNTNVVESNPLTANKLKPLPWHVYAAQRSLLLSYLFRSELGRSFNNYYADEKKRIRADINYGSENWLKAVETDFHNSLLGFCRLASANQHRPILIFQPLRTLSLAAIGKGKSNVHRKLSLRMLDNFKIAAEKCGTENADLGDLFSTDPGVFRDNYHIHKKGDLILANYFAELFAK